MDSALVHYDRAIASDSTFALALRRMYWALNIRPRSSWRYEPQIHYQVRAIALNHGLSPRDSMLLLTDSLGFRLRAAPTPDALLGNIHRVGDICEELARRYPDDPQVWYELGEAYAHFPYRAAGSARRGLEAYDRAIELDPGFAPTYMHTIELALQLGDEVRAREYARLYLAQELPDEYGPDFYFAALALDSEGVNGPAARRRLATMSAASLQWAAHGHFRWRVDSAETAIALYRELAAGGQDSWGANDYITDPLAQRQRLAHALAFRGHLQEAAELNTVSILDPEAVAESHYLDPFEALARFGLVEEKVVRTTVDQALQPHWGRGGGIAEPPRHLRLAPWLAARGDSVTLRRLVERGAWMAEHGSEPLAQLRGRYFGAAAEAYLALVRQDTADALSRFEAIPDSLCVIASCQADKLTVARLLTATGQDQRAARLLDIWERADMPRPISVLAALERGRIAERLNDYPGARRRYQFVLDAWRNADPMLRSHVESARQGLARVLTDRPPIPVVSPPVMPAGMER